MTKGDKVGLMLPNIPEFFYCYFAIVQSGAVAVLLNTSSTPAELSFLLNNSDAKILITLSSYEKRYREIEHQLSTCRGLYTVEAGENAFEAVPATAAGAQTVNIDPDDPAEIIYTAGLTGKPLGAVLTHRNLCAQLNMIQPIFRREPDDIGLCLIPLFHSFGATVNMLNVIQAGCSTVMMDRLTMDTLFAAIEREKITYICAVPRLYIGMIFHEKASKFDVSSLKLCVTGGSAMPADFIPVFEQKFGVRILEGYGLTEAAPACSFNRLEKVAKPGSIGTALTGIDAKIVDDEGRELPRSTIGELIVRGENVMQGYYKDDAATASVIKDGWLHTGDLGRMDEEDYIFLTGRKKRMIITSGFNVYPREVETVIRLHPAVRDVYVTGKEDLMRGELVKAQIVLHGGISVDDKEIIRHCKVHLSPYKVPRDVEFVSSLAVDLPHDLA
ncbi:MAG: long-chain fatty acid--CoA ligase [Deltaproteobacteria bacterium]|nr:AMP-binding protein [Syntrophaceae bacterium]NLX50751.1 long-chain fatty acid--CoA ligase [Deltaproteobacteria bacterium]